MRYVVLNLMLMLLIRCGCLVILCKLAQNKQILDKSLHFERYAWKPLMLLSEVMCMLNSVMSCAKSVISSLKYVAAFYWST